MDRKNVPLDQQYHQCVQEGNNLLAKNNPSAAAHSYVCARRVAQKLQVGVIPEIAAIWKTLEGSAERKRKAANKLRTRKRT